MAWPTSLRLKIFRTTLTENKTQEKPQRKLDWRWLAYRCWTPRDDWLVHSNFILGFLPYHQICAQSKHILPATCVLPCRRLIGELPVTSFGGHDLGDVSLRYSQQRAKFLQKKKWKMGQILYVEQNSYSRWWQLTYFVFSPLIWERFPFWLIFFRWVGSTTNQWGASWIALERLSPKMVPRRWGWHPRRPLPQATARRPH